MNAVGRHLQIYTAGRALPRAAIGFVRQVSFQAQSSPVPLIHPISSLNSYLDFEIKSAPGAAFRRGCAFRAATPKAVTTCTRSVTIKKIWPWGANQRATSLPEL